MAHPLCSVNIVAICGSLRTGSYNNVLLKRAVETARKNGATVEVLDLKELNLPLYDYDIEKRDGLTNGSIGRLRTAIGSAQGVLLASPEYNASVTAPLKNAIDWASRSPNQWNGKQVAMLGGSMGTFGTVRAQGHLRTILSTVNAYPLNTSVTIPQVHNAIDENMQIKDESVGTRLDNLAELLVQATRDAKLLDYGKHNLKQILGMEFHE